MFSKSVEYALKSLIIIDQSDENINSDMISTKLDIPKKNGSKGFINIATIMLLIGMIVCFILGTR